MNKKFADSRIVYLNTHPYLNTYKPSSRYRKIIKIRSIFFSPISAHRIETRKQVSVTFTQQLQLKKGKGNHRISSKLTFLTSV
uniref:Ovule protein n=1 Tax=Ascaris lumbricoides TaxID=6252 RepID=A0A9J2Q1C3_ASCLU